MSGAQKENKGYLTESEERNVDYSLLTPGFIRKLNANETPKSIINLCAAFVTPIVCEQEGHDPVNFISKQDEEQSDRYKEEGNRYFKAKEYARAITKYTTAIRFNPNNHLLFSNRAHCHSLIAEYKVAEEDICRCLKIDPSFVKGWHRYGLILEEFGQLGKAGVAYGTAFELSLSEFKRSARNQPNRCALKVMTDRCALSYMRFIGMLQSSNGVYDNKTLEYIESFGTEHHVSVETRMDDMLDEIKRCGASTAYLAAMKVARAKSLPHRSVDDRMFVKVVQRGRIFATWEGMFEFYEGEHQWYNEWRVAWISTDWIKHNKRCFNLQLYAGGKTVDHLTVFGKPTAKIMIQWMLQVMMYNHMEKLGPMQGIKPRVVRLVWRMRNEFDAVQAAMTTFGIHCVLQSEAEN